MKIHLSPTAAEGGGEFEAQVLDKVGTIERTVGDLKKNSAEVILADQSRWPKELKAAMEDLTKLKGVANDTQGNFDKMTKRMEQLQAIVKREARIAFGNPIERITRDEQLSARMNALIRIGLSDGERNYRKDAIGILERADLGSVAKALGEDSSPGSTLINQDLLTEVYHTLESFGIWNTFAVRALGTKTNILPVKTARAVALAIISEGTQISDDANKTGTTVTATVIDVACLINVYLRLIEDAEVDVVGDVLEDFAEAVAYRLDWFCTQADGGSDTTDGGFTGVFGGGGTDVNAANGNTTVEALDEADFRNTLLGVDAAVLQRAAKWWMHPQILVRALAIKDANKRSVFQTALEAPAAGSIGSIMGYPVILGAACPTANTAGSRVAVFGDPNGLVVGIRKGFSVDFSDHHKWDYLARSFRGYTRAAVKVRKATAFGALKLAAA